MTDLERLEERINNLINAIQEQSKSSDKIDISYTTKIGTLMSVLVMIKEVKEENSKEH